MMMPLFADCEWLPNMSGRLVAGAGLLAVGMTRSRQGELFEIQMKIPRMRIMVTSESNLEAKLKLRLSLALHSLSFSSTTSIEGAE